MPIDPALPVRTLTSTAEEHLEDTLRMYDFLNNEAATTAEVEAAVAALVAGAPGALDTLLELSAALGDDEDFAATVAASLAAKADSAHTHDLDDIADVNAAAPDDGDVLVWRDAGGGAWVPEVVGGGVTDHGALTGLADDDHPQYHNDARGDARYYTQAALDTALDGKQALSEKGVADGYAGLDGTGKVPAAQLPSSSGIGDLLDWQFARKTSNESVTSSTVLQDDDELSIAVGANQTWVFDFILILSGPPAGDLRTNISLPSGSSKRMGIGPDLAIASSASVGDAAFTAPSTTADQTYGVGGTGVHSNVTIWIRALVFTGATPGNVTLRWAQNVSDANPTTLMTNSHVTGRRVA